MRLLIASVMSIALILAFGCGSGSSITVTAPSSDARCAVTATTDIQSASSTGGAGALTIGVNRECSWTAQADATWIAFGGATSGQGPATIPFTVAPNTSVSARRARLAVNDQQIEITQGGAVVVVVPPSNPPAPPPAPTPPAPTPPAPTPPAPTPPAPTPPTPPANPSPSPGPAPAPTPPSPPSPAPSPPPTPPPAPSPPPAPPPPEAVVIDGRVNKLEGACPTLTFEIERYTVHLTAQTSISGGRCGDIKEKVKVEVRGVATSKDVVASSVAIQDKGEDDPGKKAVP